MNKEKIYYRRNPQYLFRSIAGETVLVPVGEAALNFNGMASLNETGAFLWNLLEEKRTVEELSAALAKEYELSKEQGREDCEEFLKVSLDHDLIIEEKE